MWKAKPVLKLDPAWRHAQVIGELSLGRLGLGRPVLVLGIMLHGLWDEIDRRGGRKPLPRGDADEGPRRYAWSEDIPVM
jgi:hypothetical protein